MTARKLVTYGCLILALTFCSSAGSPPVSSAATLAATNYYVDSVNGSDSNIGTSEDHPWRTLAPVQAKKFMPGNTIHFKRGSSWAGGLVIDDSGVAGNPITFTTYGIGARPVISNPGDANNWTRAVTIGADWIIVEGLLVRDAFNGGVHISGGSDHNIVRDVEVTNVGRGIVIQGAKYNLVTQNYVHDLHMVRNTPGGNDDFGAIGISFNNASDNEVSYNRLQNCQAPSYDYGTDGGALEWWGISGNNYVHHNWATDSDGFLEVGSVNGEVKDTIVAYNVSINNGWFGQFSLSGKFGTKVSNYRIENNTIVQRLPHAGERDLPILIFTDNPTPDSLSIRNNIIFVDGWDVSHYSGFTHENNLFSLNGGAQLGFALDEADMIADPLFGDLPAQDFRLLSGSPAIDAGIDLGYARDFDGNVVSLGMAPDIGAFEYIYEFIYLPLVLR